MPAWLLRLRNPSVLFFSMLLTVSIAVAAFSRPYFTTPVFRVSLHDYSLSGQQEGAAAYTSGDGPLIEVRPGDTEPERTVMIENRQYRIRAVEPEAGFSRKFLVSYPDGRSLTAINEGSVFLDFDEQGELLLFGSANVNGEEVMLEGIEKYAPSELVSAAYPEYHRTPGMPILLYVALAAMVFGWSVFRYRRLQHFLFYVSPNNLMYSNPEPSGFYYFMCKLGGIATMALSLVIAFLAYI